MDRQEAGRRIAQHALLAALREFYPVPLVELRDGSSDVSRRAVAHKRQPQRSAARAAAIREARRRVKAVRQRAVEEPPISVLNIDEWAARWHLRGLLDLAPHLIAYWQRRPAAATRFYFPRLRPLPPTPRVNPKLELHDPTQPLLAAPEFNESQADFLARAKAHYRSRADGVRQPRQLRRHSEWFVRARVQGWTAEQIAESCTTADDAPDVSTIRKGVAEFAKLLSDRN